MPPSYSGPIFAEGHFYAGNAHLIEGRLDLAESAFRRALFLMPSFAEALCNYAIVLRGRNRPEDAAIQFRRCLAVRPGFPQAQYSLAAILVQLERHREASSVYRDLVGKNPEDAESLCNLGTTELRQGLSDAADRAYRRALTLDPAHASALFNAGTIAQSREQWSVAERFYRRAFRADPTFAQSLYNLGTVFDRLGAHREAEEAYARVAELDPSNADAAYNLGLVYQGQGELERAAQAYGEALRRQPGHTDAKFNLGTVFHGQKRLDEALEQYRAALSEVPDHIGARLNVGTILLNRGDVAAADRAYVTVANESVFAEAHWNLALVRLLQGDFAAGWREYEWRWQTKDYAPDYRDPGVPLWSGEAGNGRTILLHAEQGLGDTLQFCRYVPEVIGRGWRVILEVQPPLCDLMSVFGDVRVIAKGEETPPFDAHCPLLSLPRAFGTTLETIPRRVPYLWAEAQRVETMRARLGSGPELKAGIVWAGNPAHRNDSNRSIPLEHLRPLMEMPGVRFVSLQKEPRSGDREAMAGWDAPPDDLGTELVSFADTAAAIECLDLVIAVDTSVAHLAAALARPTWVLLPRICDWRWLLDREDSPWYPTVRLFRQEAEGGWEAVISRVGRCLRDMRGQMS